MTMVRIRSSNNLALWLAIQAGMSSLSAAAIMVEVLGPRWSALFLAVTAACQVGTAAYIAAARPVESMPPNHPSVG